MAALRKGTEYKGYTIKRFYGETWIPGVEQEFKSVADAKKWIDSQEVVETVEVVEAVEVVEQYKVAIHNGEKIKFVFVNATSHEAAAAQINVACDAIGTSRQIENGSWECKSFYN
jgi:hypothetical protein